MGSVNVYFRRKKDPKTGKKVRTNERIGYIVRWFDHHHKERSKVYKGSEKEARQYLRKIEAEVDSILAGLQQIPEKRMLLNEATPQYLRYLGHIGRKPSTIKRYAKSHKAFRKFLSPKIRLSDIKRRDIEKFRIHRSRHCKAASVSTDLRHLRAFFNWCVELEYLDRSPMRGVKIRTVRTNVRFLSQEEINNLREAIGDNREARNLIDFYLFTGLRATELLPPLLTWDNISADVLTINGKGDQVREIKLSDTLLEILDMRRTLEYPFPYTYNQVYDLIVRKYYRLVGIENAGIHTLRKTAGARLIQKEVDIYRVSKFLGHSSVTVTERHYVDLLKEDYKELSKIIEKSLE